MIAFLNKNMNKYLNIDIDFLEVTELFSKSTPRFNILFSARFYFASMSRPESISFTRQLKCVKEKHSSRNERVQIRDPSRHREPHLISETETILFKSQLELEKPRFKNPSARRL